MIQSKDSKRRNYLKKIADDLKVSNPKTPKFYMEQKNHKKINPVDQ